MSKGTKKREVKKKTAEVALPAEPVKKTEVKITAAKGRPMLTWVGKRPLSYVTAFPAQHIETFAPSHSELETPHSAFWADWPASYPKGGLLFHGDNKEVLAHLLATGFRGKVNLIYIDPPFDSGADYVRKVTLRGAKGTAKLDGETYTLGEQIQYTDIWSNDNYLQFMYERLMLLKELLAENGSIYVHCDLRKNHHLRCILDEIYGLEGIISEVIWHYSGAGVPGDRWAARHDTLLWYARRNKWVFNPDPVRTEYAEATKERFSHKISNVRGENDFGEQELNPLGKYPEDVLDISIEAPSANLRTGYPTQKPEALIEKIIEASSNAGDVVLDCFSGSGTTVAVAQKLGRRWIGCDINKGAIQTTSKRLQTIIQEQIAEAKRGNLSLALSAEGNADKEPNQPAQSNFTVWRVNDYDLAIQHNEAVNLACEHIGVERTRTDAYFDGTLGKALVKIIPFGHPLTPLDLEELKRELEARPDEERPITLVCLGMELAAATWIEEWNRLRKGKGAVNKISIIELRTDPKYGKFIKHEPAKAKVKISRKKDKIAVEIDDFISPTIIERLTQQAGILKPKIDDWRAMVECVMIDTAYNGKVFNVVLSDVPEKKTDFVQGSYELPAQAGETTVAIKIIDLLGEEVLLSRLL